MDNKVLVPNVDSGNSGGANRPIGPKAKEGGPEKAKKALRVLIVEGDPAVARALKRSAELLKDKDGKFFLDTSGIRYVLSAEEALRMLGGDCKFDLIITCLKMRGMGGVAMIKHLMKEGRQDVLDKIVIATSDVEGLSADLDGKLALHLVGGRVLDKTAAPKIAQSLFHWVADGWSVQDWMPGMEYGGLGAPQKE